jgi:hypothetical protein
MHKHGACRHDKTAQAKASVKHVLHMQTLRRWCKQWSQLQSQVDTNSNKTLQQVAATLWSTVSTTACNEQLCSADLL